MKTNKLNLILVLVLGMIGFVSADVGDEFGSCGMYGMMSGAYGFGMGLFGWLMGILIIALILAAIYWLIKSANKKK